MFELFVNPTCSLGLDNLSWEQIDRSWMDGWMDGDIRWVLPFGKQWPPGGFHLSSRVSQPKPVTGSGCISKYYVYIYINRCLRFDGFYLSHTYRWCFQTFLIFNPMLWGKWSKLTKKKDQMGWFNHQRSDLPFDSRIVSSPPAWPLKPRSGRLVLLLLTWTFSSLGHPTTWTLETPWWLSASFHM